jgi:hypothetical protein
MRLHQRLMISSAFIRHSFTTFIAQSIKCISILWGKLMKVIWPNQEWSDENPIPATKLYLRYKSLIYYLGYYISKKNYYSSRFTLCLLNLSTGFRLAYGVQQRITIHLQGYLSHPGLSQMDRTLFISYMCPFPSLIYEGRFYSQFYFREEMNQIHWDFSPSLQICSTTVLIIPDGLPYIYDLSC